MMHEINYFLAMQCTLAHCFFRHRFHHCTIQKYTKNIRKNKNKIKKFGGGALPGSASGCFKKATKTFLPSNLL
jgi:hypothetical protein